MKRFLRRALVWFAWTMAAIVLLLVLFYAEEDLRGAFDWAVCQRELQAKGESLDLHELAPPGKPEDDLSEAPIFANGANPSAWFGHDGHSDNPPQIDSIREKPVDLKAWQKFYQSIPEAHSPEMAGTPAQDILRALSQFDTLISQVKTIINNPNTYWSLGDLFQPPSGHLPRGETYMEHLTKILALRGVAHLENNQTELAKEDCLLCLKFSQSISRDGSGFRFAMWPRTDANTILWEGLHRHAWNDSQLREIETALASMDLLALGKRSLRVERAGQLIFLNSFQTPDALLWQKEKQPGLGETLALLRHSRWWPSGWWDDDRCQEAAGIQQMIEAIQPAKGTLQPKAFVMERISVDLRSWYVPIGAFVRDNLCGWGPTIAQAETYRRLARLACRLEEYRLAHGQYPDKLDDLPDLPAHLNQEVLSEQRLRYQRKGDGYLLYSVGWDQKDNGGVSATDDMEGDWPWPSP